MVSNDRQQILVIGSGAAGLGVALSVADKAHVILISKGPLVGGSSQRAQGGIAAVMSAEDSYESHIQDTINVGAGLCDPAAVEFTVKNAKPAIQWLIEKGVQFTSEDGNALHLTQEGGHSHRRILHAADRTGAEVVKTLSEQVLSHPNITCYAEHTAVDLIISYNRCYGAIVMDNVTHEIKPFFAVATVLATGGASSVYLHTSNPDKTSGDGIAMAYRAGCRVKDLEFNQFHPTTLFHPDAHSFLITEAIRGEGGILRLPNGERFMSNYDDRAELASRDIVARAIDAEMKKNNIPCVYLDITHRSPEFIQHSFPTIYAECLKYNIDITRELIPVVPAAHYTCGGVVTDLKGRTDCENLYAVGEVACTGLHGANRMASNSLLECVVFAASCAADVLALLNEPAMPIPNALHYYYADHSSLDTKTLTNVIRTTLWNDVGIVRNRNRLQNALKTLKEIHQQLEVAVKENTINKELIECRNMAVVAQLIVEAALARKESCGLHFVDSF